MYYHCLPLFGWQDQILKVGIYPNPTHSGLLIKITENIGKIFVSIII
jgi:hypothetical protein